MACTDASQFACITNKKTVHSAESQMRHSRCPKLLIPVQLCHANSATRLSERVLRKSFKSYTNCGLFVQAYLHHDATHSTYKREYSIYSALTICHCNFKIQRHNSNKYSLNPQLELKDTKFLVFKYSGEYECVKNEKRIVAQIL